jgi:hypothetical protein
MSQIYEYNWPVTSVTDVALRQNLVSTQALKLNGIYADGATSQANLASAGFVAQITLSSLQNLGIPFVITGYQNGIFIQETLNGPNANTVTSVNCFDMIQSIVPTGVIPGGATVSAGIASVGYFPFIMLNSEKKITNPAYALNFVAAANPASYTAYLSLMNVANLGTYNNLITNGIFQVKTAAATVSALIQYTDVAKSLLIKVNPNANNSVLKAQFLQL